VAGLLGDSGAAACPGLWAVAHRPGRRRRAAAPHPQAGGTGRNEPAARRPHGLAGPSSGRRAVSHRERSPSRSYVLAALRALHLDSDLPRQDLGTYQEDRRGVGALRPAEPPQAPVY
jgi:hypothetical protein